MPKTKAATDLPLQRYFWQMLAFSAIVLAAQFAICKYVPPIMTEKFIIDYVENRAVEWFDELNEQEILTRERMEAREIPDDQFAPLMAYARGSGQSRMVVYDKLGNPFWTTSSFSRTPILSPETVKLRDEVYGAYTEIKLVPPSQIEHFAGANTKTEIRESTGSPEFVADVVFTLIFAGETAGYVAASYHVEEEYRAFLNDIQYSFILSSVAIYIVINLSLFLGFYFIRRHKSIAIREREYQKILQDERARQHEDMEKIAEFSSWLHSSNSSNELFTMLKTYFESLFEETKGALYMVDEESGRYCLAYRWGSFKILNNFGKDDCWALRHGRLFKYNPNKLSFTCSHTGEEINEEYMCLPLLAHGQTIGLLHIEVEQGCEESWPLTDAKMQLLLMISEQMSMSLANMRLREQLMRQSIMDPLTHVFNRRFLEKEFTRFVAGANEKTSRPGIIAFDVDHFKKFNDNYGHEAGDRVLQNIAQIAKRLFRGRAFVARPGGEEFCVVFEATDEKELCEAAEKLRAGCEASTVTHNGQGLPIVTLSLGCAIYPKNGKSVDEITNEADRALYVAKEKGRNRVETAFTPEKEKPQIVKI